MHQYIHLRCHVTRTFITFILSFLLLYKPKSNEYKDYYKPDVKKTILLKILQNQRKIKVTSIKHKQKITLKTESLSYPELLSSK